MPKPHRPHGRVWLSFVAAFAVSAIAAGQAAAADEKYGTVAIIDAATGTENIVGGEPRVCDFYFEFDLGIEASVVGWTVKTWAATPLDGTTVVSGKGGPTDADGKLRQPDTGSLSAPDGRYNVVWDDESPVDGSNGSKSFVVSCAAAGPTPTPSGSVLPVPGGGGASPSGGVEAAVGTPRLTLPPTDVTSSPPAVGWTAAALVAAGLLLTSSGVLVARQRLTRSTHRRRR
jgi:hypothetical protein